MITDEDHQRFEVVHDLIVRHAGAAAYRNLLHPAPLECRTAHRHRRLTHSKNVQRTVLFGIEHGRVGECLAHGAARMERGDGFAIQALEQWRRYCAGHTDQSSEAMRGSVHSGD